MQRDNREQEIAVSLVAAFAGGPRSSLRENRLNTRANSGTRYRVSSRCGNVSAHPSAGELHDPFLQRPFTLRAANFNTGASRCSFCGTAVKNRV